MYYEAVSQCTQMLKNIETWLDKAEKHAAAKKTVGVAAGVRTTMIDVSVEPCTCTSCGENLASLIARQVVTSGL
jgi:hypothetical protein